MINLGIVRSSQELSNVMLLGARSVLEISLGPPIMLSAHNIQTT